MGAVKETKFGTKVV